MTETDRQTDKTTRWAFTAYEPQWDLFKEIPECVKEWGWQTEVCPTTQRKHYQGYILTRTQQRFRAMTKILPGVHIEVAREWNKLLNYCKKKDTAVEGTQVHIANERKYLKFADALLRIANAYVIVPGELDDDNFNRAVIQLLYDNPDDISLYSNPQLKKAWTMTSGFWMRMALHSTPDTCGLASDNCEFCERANANCDYHTRLEDVASELFSFVEV